MLDTFYNAVYKSNSFIKRKKILFLTKHLDEKYFSIFNLMIGLLSSRKNVPLDII